MHFINSPMDNGGDVMYCVMSFSVSGLIEINIFNNILNVIIEIVNIKFKTIMSRPSYVPIIEGGNNLKMFFKDICWDYFSA